VLPTSFYGNGGTKFPKLTTCDGSPGSLPSLLPLITCSPYKTKV
jgi:hypothetical protein